MDVQPCSSKEKCTLHTVTEPADIREHVIVTAWLLPEVTEEQCLDSQGIFTPGQHQFLSILKTVQLVSPLFTKKKLGTKQLLKRYPYK